MKALRIALILVVLSTFVGIGRVTAQVPDGMDVHQVSSPQCYGQQLLPTAPITVNPGETIEIDGTVNYSNYRLALLLDLDYSISYSFEIDINGDSYNVSGYSVMSPDFFTSFSVSMSTDSLDMEFTNNSAVAIVLHALCAEPRFSAAGNSCMNLNSDFNLTTGWTALGDVQKNTGNWTLGDGAQIYQILDFTPGDYRMEIDIRAQTMAMELGLQAGDTFSTTVVDNVAFETVVFDFTASGEAYITLRIPITEDDIARLVVDRVCVFPTGDTPDPTPIPGGSCFNSAPDLNPAPAGWSALGLVEFFDGAIHIADGGQIYQWFEFEPGDYVLDIDVRVNLMEMEMIVQAGDTFSTTGYISNAAAERKRYSFTASGAGYITIKAPYDAGLPAQARIVVSRICIAEFVPYPTPTPTPTPTPQPQDISCLNEDPGFELGTWEMTGDPELTGGIMRMDTTDLIEHATSLVGTQRIWIRARTNDNIGLAIFYGDISGGGGAYYTHKMITVSDGQWRIYDFESESLPSGSSFGIEARTNEDLAPGLRAPDDRVIEIDYFCVTDDVRPTATPAPTPLPGEPTLTPTPTELPPSGCLNHDPGIDAMTYWFLSDGTIGGGVATLNPGSNLIQEFDSDPTESYEVTIRTRLQGASVAGADVHFNNSRQTIQYAGTDWFDVTLPFPRVAARSVMAQSLDVLLDDAWQPLIFFSPLPQPNWGISPISTPVAPTATPVAQQGVWANGNQIMASPGYLTIQSYAGNAGTLEIQSVCVRYGDDPGPGDDPGEDDPAQVSLFHPVCERDWSIQRRYSNNVFSRFTGMLIGRQQGTPVHAVHGGQVTAYGPDTALTIDGTRYDNCVVIDHTDVFNVPLESWSCNLRYYSIPGSFQVARGTLLGYTSENFNGFLLTALQLNGEWVNPEDYYNGYVDCRPPYVIVEKIERCAADDGSGLIPPRFNAESPNLWEVSQWVPWLAQRVYDIVGYPILCAIIPFFNAIIETIESAINAIVKSLEAPLIFIYRLSRLFEFVLDMLVHILRSILEMIDALTDVTLCLRSIIVYFVAALAASTKAEVSIERPQSGSMMYLAFQIAIELISSTVANYLLVPMTLIFAGYASWRLIPWGARKLRQAGGMGEG